MHYGVYPYFRSRLMCPLPCVRVGGWMVQDWHSIETIRSRCRERRGLARQSRWLLGRGIRTDYGEFYDMTA